MNPSTSRNNQGLFGTGHVNCRWLPTVWAPERLSFPRIVNSRSWRWHTVSCANESELVPLAVAQTTCSQRPPPYLSAVGNQGSPVASDRWRGGQCVNHPVAFQNRPGTQTKESTLK